MSMIGSRKQALRLAQADTGLAGIVVPLNQSVVIDEAFAVAVEELRVAAITVFTWESPIELYWAPVFIGFHRFRARGSRRNICALS